VEWCFHIFLQVQSCNATPQRSFESISGVCARQSMSSSNHSAFREGFIFGVREGVC
jgi:hypothetical protein